LKRSTWVNQTVCMRTDVKWHIFDTCFGPAAILFETEPLRLRELCLPNPEIESRIAAAGYGRHKSPDSFPGLKRLVGLVKSYFRGRQIDPPWDLIDLEHFSPAQKRVYRQVGRIPYGQVSTYGRVARDAGFSGGARFVGNCMARNPYPVFIPCHRVIRSDGSLGGFGGGLDLKRRMLELERASLPKSDKSVKS